MSAKVCVVCAEDCSARPRIKDNEGRYACKACVEKKKAAPRPAAAAARAPARSATLLEDEPYVDPVLAELASGVQVVESATACPSCGLPISGAVCMSCGYNAATGKAVSTRVKKPKRDMPRVKVRLPGSMVFGLIGAAAFAFLFVSAKGGETGPLMTYWIALIIWSLVTFISIMVSAFQDEHTGWGICAIASIFIAPLGIATIIYALLISPRGVLKALTLVQIGAAVGLGVLLAGV